MAGRVAQGVGPEFKPQYWKKKKGKGQAALLTVGNHPSLFHCGLWAILILGDGASLSLPRKCYRNFISMLSVFLTKRMKSLFMKNLSMKVLSMSQGKCK
jgi:hypothetical protein